MTNYIVGTYFNGEDFTNLLSNRVIKEIEKDTKNHTTEIQVVNNKNFIVVRGYTSHKSPINLSQLFINYYKELFGKEIIFNVIDLIEYNSNPDNSIIYLSKTYVVDDKLKTLQSKSFDDSFNGKDYRYTANTDMSLVIMEGDISKEDLKSQFDGFDFYKLNDSVSTYHSNNNFGKHLKTSKLFEFYFNYIVYNIFERNLCKDLTVEFFTDAEFNKINWENIKLEVKSNSLMVSEEWLKSMILDLFTFEPDLIIQKWDLENYNFENEIIRKEKPIWEVKDKTGEMILF